MQHSVVKPELEVYVLGRWQIRTVVLVGWESLGVVEGVRSNGSCDIRSSLLWS